MASVSGSWIVNRVPTPGSLSTAIVPERRSTVSLTTAMPTPRPLARSASSLVEKPGAHSNVTSDVESSAPVGTGNPASARPRRHLRRVHAAAVVFDVDGHQLAGGGRAERDRALRSLPERDPLVGRLNAMADGVTNQMEHRIHHALDQVLVDFSGLALQKQRDLLSGLARQIADHERHPAEDFTDRDQTNPHQGFAQRAQLTVDGQRALLNGAPLNSWHVRFDTRQGVEQPGPADHQIADLAHQLVQAGHVDAHDGRRRGRRRAAGPLDGGLGRRRSRFAGHRGMHPFDGDGTVLERASEIDVHGGGDDELEHDRPTGTDQRRGVDDRADLFEPLSNRIDADPAGEQVARRRKRALPRGKRESRRSIGGGSVLGVWRRRARR